MTIKRKHFSIEEIISLEKIGSVVVNNDGTMVVYKKLATDWNDNKYISELWLYEVKKKKHTQLSSKIDGNCQSPKWSSDGRTLAIIRKADGKDSKNQIFIIDVNTMAKTQVSFAKEGVYSFIWAADNKGFFYASESPEAKKLKDRHDKYGKFDYIDEDKESNSLFYLELKKGLSKAKSRYSEPEDLRTRSKKDKANKYFPSVLLLEDYNFYIYSIDASRDNRKLVFTAASSPKREDYDNLKLYLYDIKSKTVEKLEIENLEGKILFSPDSTEICFSVKKSWMFNNEIYKYNLETKEVKIVNTNLDEVLYMTQWNDKGIYLFHINRTDSKFSLINNNDKIETVLGEKGSYFSDLSCSKDGEHSAYLKYKPNELGEMYYNDVKLTNRTAILKNRKVSRKELVQWVNADGAEIEGVLSLPEDLDKNKKYPLLVIIHGGPTATSFPITLGEWAYPTETFVEKGFIVIEPNYRGSAGYGEKFRSSNFKNLGIGDYEDVISGVDYLIEQGYADRDKVGVMGWSQGGYISAFCATYSDRFKAISVGAGISNWETYYYNTDNPRFTKAYLNDVPFNDKEIYQKTSPMTHIKKAKTPTLIQHGSADKRVPVANAYELYRGLKELNINPKMVIYDNMGHGPSTPNLLRAITRQNLYWFCHHLLGEPFDGYYLKDAESKK
ncbi:MAG: S9 family peptidase [Candidatus Delongbacteria bacterium]|nr:S9 family peptidase [Candidatus Delongbacteria bacterium]MBN2836400.1 S9 family peptidase [Candidatus Delongbacteria bacterium]